MSRAERVVVFVEVAAVVVVAVVVEEVILDFTLVITIWETILLQHSKTNYTVVAKILKSINAQQRHMSSMYRGISKV